MFSILEYESGEGALHLGQEGFCGQRNAQLSDYRLINGVENVFWAKICFRVRTGDI